MSSYWLACSGIALLLSKEETDNFFLNYLRKTYNPNATNDDVKTLYDAIDDYSENEIYFLSYIRHKETMKVLTNLESTFGTQLETLQKLPKNSIFTISQYESDSNVAAFYPLDENIQRETNYITVYDDCYAIWCNKSVLPHKILSGESYHAIDEIILEFKDKLLKYMPDDFNWKAHIGFFEYAVYG